MKKLIFMRILTFSLLFFFLNSFIGRCNLVKSVNSSSSIYSNLAKIELPEEWQWKYLGYLGADFNTLAPNDSGKTLFECYQQGIDSRKEITKEPPFSVSLVATGPFRASATVTLVARVTHPSDQKIIKLELYQIDPQKGAQLCITSLAAESYEFTQPNLPEGSYQYEVRAYDDSAHVQVAKTTFEVISSNRYNRGSGKEQRYLSSIIALDGEKGIALDGIKDFQTIYHNTYPWFLRATSPLKELQEPCYHIQCDKLNGDKISYLPVNCLPKIEANIVGGQPPLVAFGSEGNGDPLYVNQWYSFSIAGAGQDLSATGDINDIQIEVYDRDLFKGGDNNIQPVYTATYTLPRLSNNDAWKKFGNDFLIEDYSIYEIRNGKQIDFNTQIYYSDSSTLTLKGGIDAQILYPSLLIKQKAGNDNFYYKISIKGLTSQKVEDAKAYLLDKTGDIPVIPIAKDAQEKNQTYNLSYTLDFKQQSSWITTILESPHFQTIPLPSAYQNKSLDELIHQTAAVKDTLPAPEKTGFDLKIIDKYTSSELKSHSTLDKLVEDLGHDPMAIANYVQNEIEFINGLGPNFNGNEGSSIDFTKVSRDALGVYLEGEGSPVEQCSLLIYLLRKAGVPCGYIFPQKGKELMFDEQISKLLKVQLRGTMDYLGNTKIPELIPINYPWVAAYIDGKWVHLFPWLKDIEVREGKDLWSYFPKGYETPQQWLMQYLLNDPNVRNPTKTTDSEILKENNPGTLLPLYASQHLAPLGLTLDDVGIKYKNRQHYYAKWEEFPHPWATPVVSLDNLAQNLEAIQNPKLEGILKDIFQTISIQVFSDRNNDQKYMEGEPMIETGSMRLTDFHNRRLLLYHQLIPGTTPQQYKMILSLEPYDLADVGSEEKPHTFHAGDNQDPNNILRGPQQVSTILQTTSGPDNDILLCYKINYDNMKEINRPLFKGDMASIALEYGRVTQKMIVFESKKYWDYQKMLADNPLLQVDQERAMGELLQVMGQSYYYEVNKFELLSEQLFKEYPIAKCAFGLVSMSPPHKEDGTVMTTTNNGIEDINLCFPKVDMSFCDFITLKNRTSHLENEDLFSNSDTGVRSLQTVEISAQEHRIINQFFKKDDAVSTVKLLDIAQGWDPKTGIAAHPKDGVVILNNVTMNDDDFSKIFNTSYFSNRIFSFNHGALKRMLGNYFFNWLRISGLEKDMLNVNGYEYALVTSAPMEAFWGQEKGYLGMGAFVFSSNGATAMITPSLNIALSNTQFRKAVEEVDNRLLSKLAYADEEQGVDGAEKFEWQKLLDASSPDATKQFAAEVEFSKKSNNLTSNALPAKENLYPQGLNHQKQLIALNGGFSGMIAGDTWMNSMSAQNIVDSSLNLTTSGQASFAYNISDTPNYFPSFHSMNDNYNTEYSQLTTGQQAIMPDTQSTLTSFANQCFHGESNFPMITSNFGKETAQYTSWLYDKGFVGATSFFNWGKGFIADPVNPTTGEFYINNIDLNLIAPMPLELRRNYTSQNQANNSLGFGWKLSDFPYLGLSIDDQSKPSTLIYAAEADGSVIAYRYQEGREPKTWSPTSIDNPTLYNNPEEKLGSSLRSKNLFNNKIVCIENGENIGYDLKGCDGSTRHYLIKEYPLSGSPEITRRRPYLESWEDGNGNKLTFERGNIPSDEDWGELKVIRSNNGNNIHFKYDIYGHITDAFANDGRHVKYSYDSYGDLVQVILPDGSNTTYSYEHKQTLPDPDHPKLPSATYSTHLLLREEKPEGRLLENIYDSERRVSVQSARIGKGADIKVTAKFQYDFHKNDDKTFTGTTTLTDVLSNTVTYKIEEGQIIKTINQNKEETTSQWETDLQKRQKISQTDLRGLKTDYHYDNQGNLIQVTQTGNLTGKNNNETATTYLSYTPTNLLESITDPLKNKTSYSYDTAHPYLPATITKPGNLVTRIYIDVNNNGTNVCGLLLEENNNGAIKNYRYDAHGFLSETTQETGTHNAALKTTFRTNRRGEIVETTLLSGTKIKNEYDAMGRPIVKETYDPMENLVDWNYTYYNGNGEPTWQQGARFNPVNYAYTSYDHMGRVTEESFWRSQASSDGSGVKDAGVVTTFHLYDDYGNKIATLDPNHNMTTMEYDPAGNMTCIVHRQGETTNSPALSTESFTYQSGGDAVSHITPLGATEKMSYTSRGQLIEKNQADGTTISYCYDLIGRVVEERLKNGSKCETTYNDSTHTVIHSYLDPQGKPLGQEIQQYDARGNLVSSTDLANNTFKNSYDSLNRLKMTAGPSLGSSTQKITHIYNDALNSHDEINAMGEHLLTFFDCLQRPVWKGIYNRDGSLAKEESNWYSPDHQSVMTTVGKESHAITTTTYTDLCGRPLILKHDDEKNAQRSTYDANGNRTSFTDELENVTQWTYDALNHLVSETLPGSAVSKYSYNATGELITRSMPQGLIETNAYNNAGQKIADSLIGSDGAVTRQHSYTYSNGLLSSITDPRGFTTSISYDGWQHPIFISSSGSKVPEQNQTTTYKYDPRGLLVSVGQCYNDASTGPSTAVFRAYDAYGQMISETTSLNKTNISSWTLGWNEAGERTALNWTLDSQGKGAQYTFDYNALGLPILAQNAFGACFYSYEDNGLLCQRKTPYGNTSITRNGRGNVIFETMKDGSQESLSWRPDGRLASYSIVGASAETRNYDYDNRGRLTTEPYLLTSSLNTTILPIGTQTASYTFDQLGVRMRQEVTPTIANAVGEQNSFSQAILDSLNKDGSNSYSLASSYDAAGAVENRSIVGGSTQNFTWDSFGRLVKVEQNGNGNNVWNTVYDGLGRRVQTSLQGNATDGQSAVIRYYYDPLVEFLELGHDCNGSRIWNLYGPDRSGIYGGAQGIGGLEVTFQENQKWSVGVVNNYFGDALGTISSGTFMPYNGVLGAYGFIPGSSVDDKNLFNLTSQWRGHYQDGTGFYYMGARYYDPMTGRFLSADPLGHEASLSLYDYCGGDPINGLDPDGRCAEGNEQIRTQNSFDPQYAPYILQSSEGRSQYPFASSSFTKRNVAIDYDGDPCAYAPLGSGLRGRDNLKNAMTLTKQLSHDVIAFGRNSKPLINSSGYYISMTSLSYGDSRIQENNINANTTPYIALGKNQTAGVQPGDYAYLQNKNNGMEALAVFADSRGNNNDGMEISEEAARQLGIEFDRDGVISDQSVTATIYPGSRLAPLARPERPLKRQFPFINISYY